MVSAFKKNFNCNYMNTRIEYIRFYKLNILIEYTFNCYIVSQRERFLRGAGVVLRTYELVYVSVLSVIPYFHISEWSTGDSK